MPQPNRTSTHQHSSPTVRLAPPSPVPAACGPEPSQEVAGLRVLVAVEHVQARGAHERQQLHHAGLACACLAHQQHRLLVPQAPAGGEDMQHKTGGRYVCASVLLMIRVR